MILPGFQKYPHYSVNFKVKMSLRKSFSDINLGLRVLFLFLICHLLFIVFQDLQKLGEKINKILHVELGELHKLSYSLVKISIYKLNKI